MSDELILSVTSALAITQALNPNERDEAGFSNADFPAAFTLVALGDLAGCAALLKLYPRQAKGHGITDEMLQPYLGESVGMASTEARSVLAQARKAASGTLAWTERKDGSILFNGIGIGFDAKKRLRAWGKHTPQGWIVDRDKLALATGDVDGDSIARLAELQEIIQSTPQVVIEAPARPAGPPPMEISVEGCTVNWTNPFSVEGVKIRMVVKLLGARWNGDARNWSLADPMALQALLLLADDLDVPVHGVEPQEALSGAAQALAEEIRSGVVKVIVLHETETHVWYRTRSKVDGAWEKAKSAGARWDSDRFGGSIRVDKADLRAVLGALDPIPNLDASPLLPMLQKFEAGQAAAIPQEVLDSIPTHTKSGMEFFAHQRDGIAYLMTLGWQDARLRGGILADDMGLGKTIQAICAADARFPKGRILIVCPASLKSNWEREIEKWLGPEDIQILSGRSDVLTDARWVIVNYDILSVYVDVLRAAQFSLVIADEAHNLKNEETQRSIAFAGRAARRANPAKGREAQEAIPGVIETCEQSWLLTGTPMMNRPKELFSLLKIINHPLSSDRWRFMTRYCAGRSSAYGTNFNGAANLGELSAKMASCYLKRLKTEVLNLPPKIRGPHVVDLSLAELSAYHAAVDAMLGRLTDGEQDEAGEPREACVLAELNALKLQTARAKIPATVELAEEIVDEGRKVVIFSGYLEVLDALQEKFGAACVRIDGSVSPAKRQAIVDSFQKDPKVQVFLGQIEAAGVGLTLTAAQDVIINDLPWTPAILLQAEDRTYRIGQTGTVNVRHMEAHGTFDARLREVLDAKSEIINAFETGADAASKARLSVVKQVLKAIKKDAKARAAAA